MTDDIPAQLTLAVAGPAADAESLETSPLGMLAPALYHAGLIWRDYEQMVFGQGEVLELHLWCTFVDRMAFENWRDNPLVQERCHEAMVAVLQVQAAANPWQVRERTCRCEASESLILRGHGFGHNKATVYCGDCCGYLQTYRVNNLLGDLAAEIESWTSVSGQVYHIWLTSNPALEEWAHRQLADPVSELNVAGRGYAIRIQERVSRPVFYRLFVPHEQRSTRCPMCCKANECFRCCACGIAY